MLQLDQYMTSIDSNRTTLNIFCMLDICCQVLILGIYSGFKSNFATHTNFALTHIFLIAYIMFINHNKTYAYSKYIENTFNMINLFLVVWFAYFIYEVRNDTNNLILTIIQILFYAFYSAFVIIYNSTMLKNIRRMNNI